MNLHQDRDGAVQEQAGKGHEVQSSKGSSQLLVVLGQAAELGHPGGTPLGDPTPRREDEAALRPGQLDQSVEDRCRGLGLTTLDHCEARDVLRPTEC